MQVLWIKSVFMYGIRVFCFGYQSFAGKNLASRMQKSELRHYTMFEYSGISYLLCAPDIYIYIYIYVFIHTKKYSIWSSPLVYPFTSNSFLVLSSWSSSICMVSIPPRFMNAVLFSNSWIWLTKEVAAS